MAERTFDDALRIASLAVARHPLTGPTVMVTSPADGEGKTTVCAGLARSLTAAGHGTVVVDLNFRRPGLHSLLGGVNELGAADVLAGRKPLSDTLQHLPVGSDKLTLLAAGAGAEPDLLRREDHLRDLLGSVADGAAFVLVDTPALESHAETLAIGTQCGAAVLVAEARRRALPRLESARDLLARNRVDVIGVVLDTIG